VKDGVTIRPLTTQPCRSAAEAAAQSAVVGAYIAVKRRSVTAIGVTFSITAMQQ